jgi:sigma-B regulation protein RsbU (phosphoserine phosphatase)
VVITSSLTGGFFNIMLAPLLVGLTLRRENMRLLIGLGVGAVIVIVAQAAIFAILGVDRSNMNGAVTSLTALAAITLSLANFMRRYQTEVKVYQDEAANKASEMEVAHEIQTSLMPPNMFTSGSWTLAARSLPAKDVGGDFYEYVPHPHMDGIISGIAIGDVAGKGIPAALQMAVVRTLFRVEARRRIFPGETLMSVNMALQAERSFGMVTMCYAFLDVNSNTLHLANAGHNYPLLLNGSLEEIKLPGLPLGIDDEIEYDEKIIQITPGTSVIFYTDGVVEAMDTEDNLFTFERLKEAVQANQKLGAEEMVEKILEEISIFTQGAPQSDDITVLVLQYDPKPDEAGCKPGELEPVGATAEAGHSSSLELEVDEDGTNWI